MKYKIFGGICLLIIGVFVVTSLVYKKNRRQMYDFMAAHNYSTFVRDYSQTLGDENAKVFVVEFMDPACETCAAFSIKVKEMMAAHPGKIKLVIRYAPFHKGADYFVKILEASKKQDKYWETLDLLFKKQSQWTRGHRALPEKVWALLPHAGLDVDQIKKDMEDPAIDRIIQQDLADANTLMVRKTPGFFVNGRPLEPFGAHQLYELIKSEVNAQY